jgi:hypothetical protein
MRVHLTRTDLGVALACLGALATSACARPRPPALPDVSQAEWSASRARLAEARREQPSHPYVERVRVTIREPRTGRRYEARGAVAVSPSHAARMVLVGPGGTTALDLWVTKDHFRFEVPAVHLAKRGGADPAEARGLPVGFLRWWFLSPLEGRLLFARSSEGESAWLLRSGPATLTVRSNGQRFVAIRRQGGALEGLEWAGRGLAPVAGAHGRYVENTFGLRVEIEVEDVLPNEPDPEAFVDPDGKDTSL